jgi:2-polyprenyl-3-methyl-5-hydroxy-6-metoxy-1,4-benzoquinol methylase
MTTECQNAEFPEQAGDNRRIWDANARWWDERIGDGNDFQTLLIAPATERLMDVRAGDTILDAACGAGRFARRMAGLEAPVVAFDYSAEFIARVRKRTSRDAAVEYHIVDAANAEALLSLGSNRFNKAVCNDGHFVCSITHPYFHSAAI